MMKWILPAIALLICGCTSTESEPKGNSDACVAGTKTCGTACVAIDSPQYGCSATSCDPCPVVEHGAAICVQGSCAQTCADGWADCDHQPKNGCETDVQTSLLACGGCGKPCASQHTASSCVQGACVVSSCEAPWKECTAAAADGCEASTDSDVNHCGACGQACGKGEACHEADCVVNPDVLAWLETQKGGWCLDDYRKLVNLCGKVSVCKLTLCGDLDTDPASSPTCYADYGHEHEKAVPFCCDTRFLKAYPNGIAVDVGFYYDGASVAELLSMGGDVDAGILRLVINAGGKLTGGVQLGGAVETTLTKGAYLVSLHVTTSRTAMYVNGVLVGEAAGAPGEVVLAADHGPGMVIGARASYWWQYPGNALRAAPFLVHLRDGAPAGEWSLKEATEASASTLLLFNDTGVSGNAWTAAVGDQTAYAIPQDYADPNPTWHTDVAKTCF